MTFEELGLHAAIIKALSEEGYTNPTPVQEQAIPAAIAGKDLLVSSQTGSGKTAAFMLPSLHHLSSLPFEPGKKTSNQERQAARSRGERFRFRAAKPKMLVLSPTRELALQVTTATDKYSNYLRHVKAISILGGMPYPKQMQLLSRNPDIIVATPGRLIDHMESGKIDFSELQILVLDEADRMLDMGFIDDIEKIVAATPESRQTMLFSATLDGVVGNIAQRITHDPEVIRITSTTSRHENIDQCVHYVDDLAHKNRLLDHILRDTSLDQAVVFTATKRDADAIADRLNLAGFAAAPLHGDMHQGARNRTLNGMRRKQVRILVATDVAARGIDVPGITHVINYDLPKFSEDYVHRIGRTGRAGRHGVAISLVNHSEANQVRRIERFTKQPIPVNVIEGFEPKKTAPARNNRKPSNWKPGSDRRSKPAGGRSHGGYNNGAPRQANGDRSHSNGDRNRSYGNNSDRSERSFSNNNDRGERSFSNNNDRGERSFGNNNDRGERSFGNNNGGNRERSHGNGGERSFGGRRSNGDGSHAPRAPRGEQRSNNYR